jgi:hypothetical protein
MVDRGRARDVNEAAARFAETLAEPYRLVYAQAAESGERQQRRAQEFSELVATTVPLPLLSQHHSTAPPSLKRYDNRYEVCMQTQ